MFTRARVPTRLVAAARSAPVAESGGLVVEIATLPSVVALGAPIRLEILFERDEGDQRLMRVASVRFGTTWVPLEEIATTWCAPWLTTLPAALGVEARRRRTSN